MMTTPTPAATVLTSTRRLRIRDVARQQPGAVAVSLAHCRRLVAVEFLSVLRIECLGAASSRFERQSVPFRKLAQVGIGSRQMVRDGACWLRHFGRVLA